MDTKQPSIEFDDDNDDFEMIDRPTLPVRSQPKQPDAKPVTKLDPNAERDSARAIEPLMAIMQARINSLQLKGPIFHCQDLPSSITRITTSKGKKKKKNTGNAVFSTFLAGIPEEHQREFTCNACKDFMDRFGDLCVVDERDGRVVPLLWPGSGEGRGIGDEEGNGAEIPKFHTESIGKINQLFYGKGARTVGDEFRIREGQSRVLGTPVTNGWTHFSVSLDEVKILPDHDPMEAQDTATTYTMLERILADNSEAVIAKVYHLIHDGQLDHAIAHKDTIRWSKDVAAKISALDANPAHPESKAVRKQNLITRYSREAFPGCLSSLRGGMVGVLLESVRDGQSFEVMQKKWNESANPLAYMRPTAAPSVGNIESAEKIFARIGITPYDLERVFMTLDRVPKGGFLWSPAPSGKDRATDTGKGNVSIGGEAVAPAPQQKLFSSLLPGNDSKKKLDAYSFVPVKDITFRSFALKVLPNAKTIEILPSKEVQPYFFTTGKEGAKPIMQFHQEGGHTASWYTWGHAMNCSEANMKQSWTPVKAIISFPHMWDHFDKPIDALNEDNVKSWKHRGDAVRYLFVLEGAKEGNARELCLFPTLMSGKFHSVRKTVEAFSDKGRIELPKGKEKQIVGGLSFEQEKKKDLMIGVRTGDGQVSRYRMTLFE